MIEQGDMVVYRCRGMFQVEKIGKLNFSGVDKKKDYFTLKSIENTKETVYIPAEERNVRKPISREEACRLIEHIEEEDTLWVPNERMREKEYKQCIARGDCQAWIQILKTLYGRAKKRGAMTSMDKKYQELTERALFGELSFALGMTEKEIQDFIKEHSRPEV